MTVLTLSAAMTIAVQCVGPALAPVMVGLAQWESGLNTEAVHVNANGSRDLGLAQINDKNLAWTGLTPQTAMDPCANLRAGAKVLLAKYNGSPPDAVKAAYAAGVTARLSAIDATTPSVPIEPPCAPAWDAWALVACSSLPSNQETIHAK